MEGVDGDESVKMMQGAKATAGSVSKMQAATGEPAVCVLWCGVVSERPLRQARKSEGLL